MSAQYLARREGWFAVGIDGTIILFKDVFHDKQPGTIRYEAIRGIVRRILSADKYLFLLTSEGLYVIFGLVEHYLAGSEVNPFTPILVVPMQGTDANVVGDRWILIVTQGGVLRMDIDLLQPISSPEDTSALERVGHTPPAKNVKQITPRGVFVMDFGLSCQFRPRFLRSIEIFR